MDERAALEIVQEYVDAAGDDAAVVDGHVLTSDMLHQQADFPPGVTRYTAGWRAVGASLSDVAAMGGRAVAAVAVYAAPTFEESELVDFLEGATDVCASVDAQYVGGDLDQHDEFTVVSTVLGACESPVRRSGAQPGDRVFVTGTLGRTAAGLAAFEAGAVQEGNELFRFPPRVPTGRTISPVATAMIDSSDGLARSLHQLARASDCGFDIDREAIPIDEAVRNRARNIEEAFELATFVGEDFELVFTAPPDAPGGRPLNDSAPITEIGTVTGDGVTIDGKPLPDRGYAHGS